MDVPEQSLSAFQLSMKHVECVLLEEIVAYFTKCCILDNGERIGDCSRVIIVQSVVASVTAAVPAGVTTIPRHERFVTETTRL